MLQFVGDAGEHIQAVALLGVHLGSGSQLLAGEQVDDGADHGGGADVDRHAVLQVAGIAGLEADHAAVMQDRGVFAGQAGAVGEYGRRDARNAQLRADLLFEGGLIGKGRLMDGDELLGHIGTEIEIGHIAAGQDLVLALLLHQLHRVVRIGADQAGQADARFKVLFGNELAVGFGGLGRILGNDAHTALAARSFTVARIVDEQARIEQRIQKRFAFRAGNLPVFGDNGDCWHATPSQYSTGKGARKRTDAASALANDIISRRKRECMRSKGTKQNTPVAPALISSKQCSTYHNLIDYRENR